MATHAQGPPLPQDPTAGCECSRKRNEKGL